MSYLNKLLHYQSSVVVCNVFPARVGESLLSSEGNDPSLTSRRYYFSVLALRPKSCQHIFYPLALTIYFRALPLYFLEDLFHGLTSSSCAHWNDGEQIQGDDGGLNVYKNKESMS